MDPPILKMEMKMGGLWVNKKEKSETQVRRLEKRQNTTQQNTYQAMGNVTNNEINCIKLKPMDFAPSDSSKRPPSDNVS